MNAIIIGFYGSIKGNNSNSSMELCNYRGMMESCGATIFRTQCSVAAVDCFFCGASVASEQQT